MLTLALFPWLIKYFPNELSAHPLSIVTTFRLSSSGLLGFSEFYADRKHSGEKKNLFSLYLKKDIFICCLPPELTVPKLGAETFTHIYLYTIRSVKWALSTGEALYWHNPAGLPPLQPSCPQGPGVLPFPKKSCWDPHPASPMPRSQSLHSFFYYYLFILSNVWVLWSHYVCVPRACLMSEGAKRGQ